MSPALDGVSCPAAPPVLQSPLLDDSQPDPILILSSFVPSLRFAVFADFSYFRRREHLMPASAPAYPALRKTPWDSSTEKGP